MSDAPAVTSQLGVRLAAIEHACRSWCERPAEFEEAVSASVEHFGDSAAEVGAQLERIAREMTAKQLAQAIDAQTHGQRERLAGAPASVLHLVAGTVPGLAIESLLWGLAVGTHNLCRPSRDDTTVRAFLRFLDRLAPRLAARIELVEQVEWAEVGGAIVYGSDDTVALVREHIGDDRPVVGYGSRTAIAVVTNSALASPDVGAQLALLANDVTRFGQRGCMSPSRLYVLGEADVMSLATDLEHALHAARPDVDDDPYARRAADDAAALASVAGSDTLVVHGGGATLSIETLMAVTEVRALGDLLQTAVLICTAKERSDCSAALMAAGCSRVCDAGWAHEPPFSWWHDGLGRIAPLLPPPAS